MHVVPPIYTHPTTDCMEYRDLEAGDECGNDHGASGVVADVDEEGGKAHAQEWRV